MHADVKKFDEYAATYEGLDKKGITILRVDKVQVSSHDDDAFYIIAGRTNAGKSTLAHHLHDLWTSGEPDVSRVSLDRDEFPIKAEKTLQLPDIRLRVTHYDEANISRREAMGVFNRDLLTFYFSVRGKRALHIWCNPSLEILDRPFIEERVNGVWYIYKRPKGRYVFIPRESLLRMIDDKVNFKQDSIEKNAHKYALIFKGRFKKYPQNDFKKAYDRLKETRTDHVARWLREKHHKGETFTERGTAKHLGVSLGTVRKYTDEMINKGLFDKDSYRNAVGRLQYDKEAVHKIKEYIEGAQ